AMARDEGWMAEHMLILKLTSPEGKSYTITGAFPSATGKTNLALIDPTLEGWTAETLGDDIAWITPDDDKNLRVVNLEYGFFGVAPGTGGNTNPNAMRAISKGNTIFTHVALTAEGAVGREGLTEEQPAKLIARVGNDWTPESETPAAHPNSRFCTPIDQTDMLADEYFDPEGIKLDAILFGGRRDNATPLVTEAHSWQDGVFKGATLSSARTAAAEASFGEVRRDPMAMLPFMGYAAGDYVQHCLDMEHKVDHLPRVFLVNWFRRNADGKISWPGFGENSRVLKWIVERLEGTGKGTDTPIGVVPTEEALDISGLDISHDDLINSIKFEADEWREEIPMIADWLATFGDKLPQAMSDELQDLKNRLGFS